MKKSNTVLVMLVALAAFGPALAADSESACRLRGGSIVPLPADACAKEGGTMVTVTIAPAPVPAGAAPAVAAPAAAPAPSAPVASAPAPVLQLSAEPKRAAAQRAIIELLGKPVVSKVSRKEGPESIERTARFDECRLTVEENVHLDYGNLMSTREDFKVASTVDFRTVGAKESGVLGEVSSKGGDLDAYAVYVESPTRRAGNALSIGVSVAEKAGYRKFISPDSSAYWAGPRFDYWMADRYGYPKADDLGHIYTNVVRVLFVVPTQDDAAALKKAFDDMHAACSR